MCLISLLEKNIVVPDFTGLNLMISELFAEYQFGAIHIVDIIITNCKVTNRALCSAESKIVRRLYPPHPLFQYLAYKAVGPF